MIPSSNGHAQPLYHGDLDELAYMKFSWLFLCYACEIFSGLQDWQRKKDKFVDWQLDYGC